MSAPFFLFFFPYVKYFNNGNTLAHIAVCMCMGTYNYSSVGRLRQDRSNVKLGSHGESGVGWGIMQVHEQYG